MAIVDSSRRELIFIVMVECIADFGKASGAIKHDVAKLQRGTGAAQINAPLVIDECVWVDF